MRGISVGIGSRGRMPLVTAEPYYYKVGLGFKNSYGICKVFGEPLGSPYSCTDWIFNEEPQVWSDRTNSTIDCTPLSNKISSDCCEIVGTIVNWHYLGTGLTCYFSLQRKEGSLWVTQPLMTQEGETTEFRLDAQDPHEQGYDYWDWWSMLVWMGTWEGNTKYEISKDGKYRIKIREKNNKFNTKYIYFNVRNIPECREGTTKCEGYDLYKCINGKWQLVEANSEQCGYQPPSPPSPPGYAFVYGTVKDILGRPISGAKVRINSLSTTTDSYGRFSLDIPLVTAIKISKMLVVEKEGYITHFREIELEEGTTLNMTIYMIPKMAVYVGGGLAAAAIIYALLKK